MSAKNNKKAGAHNASPEETTISKPHFTPEHLAWLKDFDAETARQKKREIRRKCRIVRDAMRGRITAAEATFRLWREGLLHV